MASPGAMAEPQMTTPTRAAGGRGRITVRRALFLVLLSLIIFALGMVALVLLPEEPTSGTSVALFDEGLLLLDTLLAAPTESQFRQEAARKDFYVRRLGASSTEFSERRCLGPSSRSIEIRTIHDGEDDWHVASAYLEAHGPKARWSVLRMSAPWAGREVVSRTFEMYERREPQH